MLGRDPSQKPTSWEVNHEVYAASWEKLLGTIPPPQMTEQEADEALEKMGKDKQEKLQTHARMLHGRGGHTPYPEMESWRSKEELIRWCWLC